ncbi:MAG: sigma-54 dependent transcriptional regulator [Prevotella sp.]|nr:sigma-54 dependent transcriptional regulator [Prevotella sp.]
MRILIVEDDLTFATMIQTWLRKHGYEVEKTSSVGAAAKLLLDGKIFDLVLSDLRLPDHDGLFLLSWMQKHNMSCPFIVMTNYAEVQNAVLAMKSGACDYIAKPVQPDILLQKISDAINDNSQIQTATQRQIQDTVKQGNIDKPASIPRYIEGNSNASKQIYEYVSLVAPTSMSVLILGASGTGKEHAARQIHELSSRKDKPFVALDCGAVPRDVAASEFFGYVKGAFTGATTNKKGAFEEADGGTLFLDEIGNLSYDVQVQLLRALQERKIRRLGSTQEISVDIRLVCATNGNLEQNVADGKFREDLYHRINEFTLYIPELKDRGDDLYIFADFFLKQSNENLGRNIIGFDDKASEMLARYSWPGNLRELNNVIKRATLLAKGSYITKEDLDHSMSSSIHQDVTVTLHDEDTEIARIKSALRSTGGNKTQTAKMLGIDRKTLYNKMQKYGLQS